ncbi:hypothetical protein ACOSOMT5_P1914 [Acidiphilium sp. MT5]
MIRRWGVYFSVRGGLGFAALVSIGTGYARAQPAPVPVPVVVELFTSQACSDCPPADRLLRREQASQPGLIALDLHVTYWNSPAWRDRFSSRAATARQQFYVDRGLTHELYTPEAVVDGRVGMVGSDKARLNAAIAASRANPGPRVPITITQQASAAMVQVAAGQAPADAHVIAFAIDPIEHTKVGGGENDGADLTEINVVRSIEMLGVWTGSALSKTVKLAPGQHVAVIVQTRDGAIIGAAMR